MHWECWRDYSLIKQLCAKSREMCGAKSKNIKKTCKLKRKKWKKKNPFGQGLSSHQEAKNPRN
jgi:hypothetical protein